MGAHSNDRNGRDHFGRDEIASTDAFLDALSRGEDPSGGEDELAGLLLGLRDTVCKPGPAAPILAAVRAASLQDATNPRMPVTRNEAEDEQPATTTTVFPAAVGGPSSANAQPVTAGKGYPSAAQRMVPPQQEISVAGGVQSPTPPVGDSADELAPLRQRRQHFTHGWLGHGLIGAAAATLVIAGTGGLIHAAKPGDPLWGLNQALFTNHAAVVELTATLEEADSRNAKGDVKGALKLLEQARALAQEMNAKDKPQTPPPPPAETITATATATTTVVAPPPPPVTVTATVTPPRPTPPAVKPSAPGLPPGVTPTTAPVAPPTFPTNDLKPSTTGTDIGRPVVTQPLVPPTLSPLTPTTVPTPVEEETAP